MLPLLSTKKNREDVIILGVSHITANLNAVLRELSLLDIDEKTVVFVEPKKNIITGKENCEKLHISNFFAQILRHIMLKKATFVPLNATYMPSHNSTIIIHKYANQLAEEEYMADVIDTINAAGQKIVIIGDIHAERLKRLLSQKGNRVGYHKVSPLTPDDILIRRFRDAIEGRRSSFISMSWLRDINEEIRQNMNIKKSSVISVQEAVWGDEDLYRRYQHEARKVMRKFKLKRYLVKVDKDTTEMSRDIYEVAKKALEHFKKEDDHPILAFPYSALLSV